MNCCSVVPGVLSLSRTRASRACSATRSRSCSTGRAKRMIRSTRVPESAATCSGVSPARMRDWITRGASSVPSSTSIWVSRRESPRAAARTRSSTGSENFSSPCSVSATRSRLEPSSESPTRRSVRTGDLLQGVSGRAPERDRARGYPRTPAARRRRARPGASRRPHPIGVWARNRHLSMTSGTSPGNVRSAQWAPRCDGRDCWGGGATARRRFVAGGAGPDRRRGILPLAFRPGRTCS